MNEALAGVVRAIKSLDLKIAPQKSEALYFHDGSRGAPPVSHIVMDGTRVIVGQRMKYLGLIIDEKWSFETHFKQLAPRLEVVTNQCSRLMPNLGGPGGKARRLYAMAINSVAMYGSPAWAVEAGRSKRILAILRTALRRVAVRVVRGYRTVSFAGSSLLAGLPPLEMLASMYAETFRRVRAKREELAGGLTSWHVNAIKIMAKRKMYERWEEWARDHTLNGQRIREAICPSMVRWVDRRSGHLTYRLTQVMSGHGCFGQFLHMIGKEDTPECHHCPARVDSAQHTLAECAAWSEERDELKRTIGNDLDLPRVVDEMLREEDKWKVVVNYCEKVLLKKEEAARTRRGEIPRAASQRRGRGRGRGGRARPGGRG